MITAHEALRQCIEAMKLVDFKDCGESPELWQKLNAAQANAERVLKSLPLTDAEIDAAMFPPRAQLKAEDWDPATKRPRPVQAERVLRESLDKVMLADEVIAALDALHEGCNEQSWTGWQNGHGEEVGDRLERALQAYKAAPVLREGEKQEPLAWFCVNTVTGKMRYTNSQSEMVEMRDQKAKHWEVTPLYTNPAPSLQAVVEVPEGVIKAAIAWWEACRPVGWSEASHIEHPYVNTLTEEGNLLGKAVAAYVRNATANLFADTDFLACGSEPILSAAKLTCPLNHPPRLLAMMRNNYAGKAG
jgi:hypothetical protein